MRGRLFDEFHGVSHWPYTHTIYEYDDIVWNLPCAMHKYIAYYTVCFIVCAQTQSNFHQDRQVDTHRLMYIIPLLRRYKIPNTTHHTHYARSVRRNFFVNYLKHRLRLPQSLHLQRKRRDVLVARKKSSEQSFIVLPPFGLEII